MKIVGRHFYVHKSAVEQLRSVTLGTDYEHIRIAMNYADGNVKYDVVKYDKDNRMLCLVQCLDFDKQKEPTIECMYRIDLRTGDMKFIKGRTYNKQIYHSKELFVNDDYTGFDIEAAKKRTTEWNSIPGLDKKKIGNINYWREFLRVNGMEV